MKKPQFKELNFESEKAFQEWLKTNTHKQIILDDRSGDMSKIWVHESGEILHCNFHASIYNGKFVEMDLLTVGNPLIINDEAFYNLVPEKLI